MTEHRRVLAIRFEKCMYSEEHARFWLATHAYTPLGRMLTTRMHLVFPLCAPWPGSRFCLEEERSYSGIYLQVEYDYDRVSGGENDPPE